MTDGVLEGGQRFRYASVAARYAARPRYPPELFAALLDLLPNAPRTVLDVGCGPGKLALGLADRIERVDAVDPSGPMLAAARVAAGTRADVRWIHAPFEDAELDPPYGLVTAGASFHWLDADVALTRIAAALAPGGCLAVVDGDAPEAAPWSAEEAAIHVRFIERMAHKPTFPRGGGYRPPSADDRVLEHPRFRRRGRRVLRHEASTTVADYIACLHSRQSFVLEAMGNGPAHEFDVALGELLESHASEGLLRFTVATRLEWGDALPA